MAAAYSASISATRSRVSPSNLLARFSARLASRLALRAARLSPEFMEGTPHGCQWRSDSRITGRPWNRVERRSTRPCKKRPAPRAGCKFTAARPMVAPSFLSALGFRLSLTRSGIMRESGAGANPRVPGRVVVGVAVVVAVTDVGRRTTHDGAKPPIDTNNKVRPALIVAHPARLAPWPRGARPPCGPRRGGPPWTRSL